MVTDYLIKLASIKSPSGFEAEVGKYVYEELEKLGVNVTFDSEGNLLGRTEGKGKPILISAHLDTVEEKARIKPIITDGKIKSSGNTILGADNKAAIAAILSSLGRVPKGRRKSLEIVFSVREETDGGVSKMDTSWIRSETGISADSGETIGSVISETPCISAFEIVVIGKSAHSSEPENGINALSIASHAISSFKWGAIDENTTANIGLIEGGSAVNTTPGRIYLKGEIRSSQKSHLEKIQSDLESVFKRSAAIFKGKVKIKHNYYCDGYNYNGNEISLKQIKEIYRKLKIKSTMRKSFGASDANFFYSKGITVVDIGDGVRNPHTTNEFVKVKDLKKLTNIFTNYIKA